MIYSSQLIYNSKSIALSYFIYFDLSIFLASTKSRYKPAKVPSIFNDKKKKQLTKEEQLVKLQAVKTTQLVRTTKSTKVSWTRRGGMGAGMAHR